MGAHWDTVPDSPGVDDNGSGVAAILELARALHDGNCTNKYTIILVAFDLEELGSDGSLQFIQDFLIPRVLSPLSGVPKSQFQGMIVKVFSVHYYMNYYDICTG